MLALLVFVETGFLNAQVVNKRVLVFVGEVFYLVCKMVSCYLLSGNFPVAAARSLRRASKQSSRNKDKGVQ